MTLEATTQHHARSAIMPLSWRHRVDRMHGSPRSRCEMASDTMDPRCKGMRNYRYCQVFGNKEMFSTAYLIEKKSDCHRALKEFLREYGAPNNLITDRSKEQTDPGKEFQSMLRKNNVIPKQTQSHRPNQNLAENEIRELRKKWHRSMFKIDRPRALWSYGLPHFVKIMQITATYAVRLNGQTLLGHITGETPDISQHLDFGWYD